MRPASVLCYGHDTNLIKTRLWLLEQAGCVARAASVEAEAHSNLLHHATDIFVLCQTLSENECRAVADFAQQHTPAARCLLLYMRSDKTRLDREHVALDVDLGPAVFLRTVAFMLPAGVAWHPQTSSGLHAAAN